MSYKYVPKGTHKQYWFAVYWPDGLEQYIQARNAQEALTKSKRIALGATTARKIGGQ